MAVCAVFTNSYATDIGNMGLTYPIAERDLVEVIKERIAEKRAAGELEKLNNELAEKSQSYVRRPPGSGLPRTKSYRAFAIDPTYTVPVDVVDADGKILYAAGAAFNPLRVKALTRTLCFINADDEEQIQWMERYCVNDQAFKRILVSGDFNATTKRTQKRLYFDQYGVLVAKFRIQSVPATIRQSGDYLYVEEIIP